MTIKNRLKKLETASTNGCPVLSPKFVVFEGMETERAIIPGHEGGFHREKGENLGEFCQRVFKAYVNSMGLEKHRANELSDEDLQCLIAAGSPKMAIKMHRNGELSDDDIQLVLTE